jgi:hypothetical protein
MCWERCQYGEMDCANRVPIKGAQCDACYLDEQQSEYYNLVYGRY